MLAFSPGDFRVSCMHRQGPVMLWPAVHVLSIFELWLLGQCATSGISCGLVMRQEALTCIDAISWKHCLSEQKLDTLLCSKRAKEPQSRTVISIRIKLKLYANATLPRACMDT